MNIASRTPNIFSPVDPDRPQQTRDMMNAKNPNMPHMADNVRSENFTIVFCLSVGGAGGATISLGGADAAGTGSFAIGVPSNSEVTAGVFAAGAGAAVVAGAAAAGIAGALGDATGVVAALVTGAGADLVAIYIVLTFNFNMFT
jgi:hypothetical protein